MRQKTLRDPFDGPMRYASDTQSSSEITHHPTPHAGSHPTGIRAEVGGRYEQVRRDINGYIAGVDELNMENIAAMRAERYQVPQERRATITYRKESVTQLITKLRLRLDPETFAVVTDALAEPLRVDADPAAGGSPEGEGTTAAHHAPSWD